MSGAVMHDSLSLVAGAVAWSLAGVLLGILHFVSLRWNVRCILGGRPLASLGLHLLRLMVTGMALALVAKLFGAVPLLAGTLGLMAARTGVVLLEPQR